MALIIPILICQAQSFYFSNDLSYVNQMEDCGAVFKESGIPKDVYEIFADRGSNLVSVRLWVDPSWWQGILEQPEGVKSFYNDIEDVKETIRRSKEAEMQVMLGFHYSDFWADPGRQLIPRAWLDVAYDLQALKDSVYNYTLNVLTELNREGLMPEFVKVGNESNHGILYHIPEEDGYDPVATVSSSWSRHAQLYNSAIQAIRAIGDTAAIDPKIVIHFAGLNQQSNFENIMSYGVTDFDIVGISYYYAWHDASIAQLQSTIASMVETFAGYDVMVIETGYPWTLEDFDQLPNIITTPDPQYLPVIPEKQLEYLVDYTRAVMKAGGIGVIFWEPAWVSTPCRTPWSVGSSHDHVVFFDPDNNNFIENGGGRWMEQRFYEDLETTHKVTFKVDMSGQDVSNGVYITGSFTGDEWKIVPMAEVADSVYYYFTYLQEGATGGYYFLNDSAWSAREIVPDGCALWQDTDRYYEVPDKDVIFISEFGHCASDSEETGVPIELENPSFEQPGVETRNWTAIPGWNLDQPAIDSGVAPNNLATDSAFVAWLDSDDGELWQLTDYTIMAGDVFTLKADVRNSWQSTSFDLRLFYDDNSSRITVAKTTGYFSGQSDAFLSEYKVRFAADSNASSIGKNLGVVIENTSGPNSFIEMDNFRLYKDLSTDIRYQKNIIDAFILEQNYPNPFNNQTRIEYKLEHSGNIMIIVFNAYGQLVSTLVNQYQTTGAYSINWSGYNNSGVSLSSGIYYIKLITEHGSQTRKALIVK